MLINLWHTFLNMPKKTEAWHLEDIQDELNELKTARGWVNIWSEKSDVVYAYTRARWGGHHNIEFPLSRLDYLIGIIYMMPKYTLRWFFFRAVGKRISPHVKVTEVRNPGKIEKLHHIAKKYNFDPNLFEKECKKFLKFWVFLK